jgi:hypothetical protein
MGEFDYIAEAMRESPVVSAFAEMSLAGDFSALEKRFAALRTVSNREN